MDKRMEIDQQYFTGERALFHARGLRIVRSTFADGESPLKESADISLDGCMFRWKYPLWYSRRVQMTDCTLFSTARAGIWYTDDITVRNTVIEAPKTFRRARGVVLENVTMPDAAETLWNCKDVRMKNVTAKGNYFAMNAEDFTVDGLTLSGDYCFDGAKNVIVRNSRLLSKDAFWNSSNVEVYDSFISGEYLGWNAENLTFVNCTIESLQGLCYVKNLVLKNCRLLNTTLAFEYSTVQAEIVGRVDSVLNPLGGKIVADEIGELTVESDKVDPSRTVVVCAKATNGAPCKILHCCQNGDGGKKKDVV